MLAVKMNRLQFEYEIHSMVKAFYPEQTVKVFEEGTRELASDGDVPEISIRIEDSFVLVQAGDRRGEFVPERPEDRIAVKNELKRLLYRLLAEYTHRQLPWGTLTGIRPAKLAMGMLEEGKDDGDVLAYMRDMYYCSDRKAQLALDIAKREQEILKAVHYERGYSLYIGIPFCPTTCLYCSFPSFPIAAWKKRVGDYLAALEKEIDFVKKACRDRILDSVYIGGGTPTTLEPEELRRLLAAVREKLDFSQVKEFTVEAGRADSITREKLQGMQEYGVTRISVNPQTMNQETLDFIGRRHTVEQVQEAFHMAREEGFTNVNMDLILGLPGEGEEQVAYTMRQVEALAPDSLTVHSLAVKRASRMSQWIEENGFGELNNTEQTMEIAARGAERMGMEPYYLYRQKNMSGNFENVGYAIKGRYGLYNILIMEEKQDILALGAGTISKAVYPDGRIERCDSVKDVALYLEKIDEMIDRKRRLLEEKLISI